MMYCNFPNNYVFESACVKSLVYVQDKHFSVFTNISLYTNFRCSHCLHATHCVAFWLISAN